MTVVAPPSIDSRSSGVDSLAPHVAPTSAAAGANVRTARARRSRTAFAALGLALGVAGLFALGYVPEHEALVAQAEATREYARSTLERHSLLAEQGLTTAQELARHKAQAEVDVASVGVARAKRSGALAELHRLEQLKAFARVSSPFAGAVSARYVDRGSLVASSGTTPLFEIVATDPVRVTVQVPQSRVRDVKQGLPAEVRVNEYPELTFAGKVTRTSGTLDTASRSMNLEIVVPNPEGKLMPGMYASVSFKLTSARRPFVLPASALITQNTGVAVALLDADNRVRFSPIEIERDNGSDVEIKRGIQGGERVIGTPSPGLVDGQVVSPLP